MRRTISVALSFALLAQGLPAFAASRQGRGATAAAVKGAALRLPAALAPLAARVVNPQSSLPAPAASAVAAAQAAQAESPLLQAGALEKASASAPASADAGGAELIWSKARAASGSVAVEAPTQTAKTKSGRRLERARAAAVAALTGAAVPLPAMAAPPAAAKGTAAAAGAKAAAMPAYLSVGIFAAGLVATHYTARAVRWGVEKWGARGDKDANEVAWPRLVGTIAVWVTGVTMTLSAAGVSMETALASVGGVGGAVALLVSQEITNLLESVKFLLARPFHIGDKIRKGGKDYEVRDLELRYVELGAYQSSEERPEYRQLVLAPVTVLRPYEAPTLVRPRVVSATLWLAAAAALVVGLPWAIGLTGLPWLAALVPWLKAGALLFATRRAELWAAAIVEKLAGFLRLSRYRADVLSFLVRAAVYIGGIGLVLAAFNITWMAALTSVGVSSLVLGWIVRETLQSLYFGIKILWTQPFRVGDTIEVATITGRVVEMNLFYVVLEHKEKTHTLVPYAVFKDSPAVRLSADDADTSMPKPTPGSSLPPSKRDAASEASAKAAADAAAAAAIVLGPKQ